MEKVLLITGFEPFGGQSVNPSWEAVKLLPEHCGGYILHKMCLSVVYGRAAALCIQAAQECGADTVLCIGQAGSRTGVTPERIGINCRAARIPDNDGNAPTGEPCVPGAPDGLFSTVPVQAIADAICAVGLPASVSNTAGTFVCNDLLYTVLQFFRGTGVRAGFVHVPYLPEQGEPSLPLADIVRALTAAIEVLDG